MLSTIAKLRYDLCVFGVLGHTIATLMIAGGMSIKTVSARLGHSGIAITSDLYSHAIKSVDALAAETLNDILSPAKNVKKKLKLG